MNFQFASAALVCLTLLGCSNPADQGEVSDDSIAPIVMDELPPTLDGHPDHGPHGGELVELGKEAFHIELVHGSGSVAFYVLDGSATTAVAIESDRLSVSLKHDGEVQAFELSADPQADDEPGTSSRFQSTDAQLEQWMEAGAEGAVSVQIDGKSYTGKITHDHDHSDHDHSGHDHSGHDH